MLDPFHAVTAALWRHAAPQRDIPGPDGLVARWLASGTEQLTQRPDCRDADEQAVQRPAVDRAGGQTPPAPLKIHFQILPQR